MSRRNNSAVRANGTVHIGQKELANLRDEVLANLAEEQQKALTILGTVAQATGGIPTQYLPYPIAVPYYGSHCLERVGQQWRIRLYCRGNAIALGSDHDYLKTDCLEHVPSLLAYLEHEIGVGTYDDEIAEAYLDSLSA